MSIKKTILVASCFAFAPVTITGLQGVGQKVAWSQVATFDAVQAVNMVQSLLNQAAEMQNQIRMLQGLGADFSPEIMTAMQDVNYVLNHVQGIVNTFEDVANNFDTLYPNGFNGMSNDDFAQLAINLRNQTREAQKHSAEIQASVAQSIPQTQSTVNQIVSRSNSSVGPTSATQANTQMLATVSAQLTQMQSLLMAQTKALNAQIQEQNTLTEIAKERHKTMFDGMERRPARTDGFDPFR